MIARLFHQVYSTINIYDIVETVFFQIETGRKTETVESLHPASFEKQYNPEERILDVRNEAG